MPFLRRRNNSYNTLSNCEMEIKRDTASHKAGQYKYTAI